MNQSQSKKIHDFKIKIHQTACSDLPNTFWDRKRHGVNLFYEIGFDEKKYLLSLDQFK